MVFSILLNVPYTYRDFSFAFGNFHTIACFHTLVWKKSYKSMGKIIHVWKISYTSIENFPLHVWVNNFQYSMENF